MAIEDKNGCLHSEKDGKFVCKNKPYNSQENKAQVLARRVNSKYDNMSAKELSKILAINTKKNTIVMLGKNEYAQLCSAIRTKFADKIPQNGNLLLGDKFYRFKYNKSKEQILCVFSIAIEGNEDLIKNHLKGN